MCARHARLSPEETRLSCDRALQEVRWFRHTVQVAVQSQRRCEQEISSYAEQCVELDRAIAESRVEIKRLGDNLEECRNNKRHKVAYDEIAVEANNRPTRERLLRDFEELNAEIEQLRQEEASHEIVVGALHAQFQVVISELGKLEETSKNALSMQDLGIFLGDGEAYADDTNADAIGDADCEKASGSLSAGPTVGISPTTPRQPDASHDDFNALADGAPQGDSVVARDNPITGQLEEDEHGYDGREEGEDGNSETSYGSRAKSAQLGAEIGPGSEEEEGECLGEDEEGELLG
ncbi:hypothetical protein GGI20_004170 [Coemansia sp. BCRC 34301]|nr:hypothetical protein GGI20_004170 [Coemansia sp. BCRC 34301]